MSRENDFFEHQLPKIEPFDPDCYYLGTVSPQNYHLKHEKDLPDEATREYCYEDRFNVIGLRNLFRGKFPRDCRCFTLGEYRALTEVMIENEIKAKLPHTLWNYLNRVVGRAANRYELTVPEIRMFVYHGYWYYQQPGWESKGRYKIPKLYVRPEIPKVYQIDGLFYMKHELKLIDGKLHVRKNLPAISDGFTLDGSKDDHVQAKKSDEKDDDDEIQIIENTDDNDEPIYVEKVSPIEEIDDFEETEESENVEEHEKSHELENQVNEDVSNVLAKNIKEELEEIQTDVSTRKDSTPFCLIPVGVRSIAPAEPRHSSYYSQRQSYPYHRSPTRSTSRDVEHHSRQSEENRNSTPRSTKGHSIGGHVDEEKYEKRREEQQKADEKLREEQLKRADQKRLEVQQRANERRRQEQSADEKLREEQLKRADQKRLEVQQRADERRREEKRMAQREKFCEEQLKRADQKQEDVSHGLAKDIKEELEEIQTDVSTRKDSTPLCLIPVGVRSIAPAEPKYSSYSSHRSPTRSSSRDVEYHSRQSEENLSSTSRSTKRHIIGGHLYDEKCRDEQQRADEKLRDEQLKRADQKRLEVQQRADERRRQEQIANEKLREEQLKRANQEPLDETEEVIRHVLNFRAEGFEYLRTRPSIMPDLEARLPTQEQIEKDKEHEELHRELLQSLQRKRQFPYDSEKKTKTPRFL